MTEKLRGVFMRWFDKRSEYNGLAADAPEEKRAALRGELATLDNELADTLKAEPVHTAVDGPEMDAEGRERLALRAKAKVGAWFRAAVTGRPVRDGAEAEYAAAEGVDDGTMPIAILERERQVEHRVITPAPATTAIQQHAIVPALFDRSIAGYLGIAMPSVAIGTPAYPYLSTSVTAGMKAKSAAAAETAGAFSVDTASPRRLTGSFKFTREDAAVLQGLEESLRMNLQSVMSDKLDDQILNGNNVAPNLKGLLNALTDPTAPEANAETFDRYVAALASHVDGLHATMNSDVRVLVGVSTYQHMSALFRGTDGPVSAGTYLMNNFGGVRATRRIAAAVSNIQQAVVRRGMEADIAKAPVWSGMELIRDPYKGAGTGEITVTAVSLVGGLAFTRLDAFVQDSFRIGA